MARSQSPFAGAAGSSAAAGSSVSPSPAHSPGYLAVAKWTKRVDIFSRDFLVVPINESTHWSVAIICYPAKFFQPPPLQSTTREATGKATEGQKKGGGARDGGSLALDQSICMCPRSLRLPLLLCAARPPYVAFATSPLALLLSLPLQPPLPPLLTVSCRASRIIWAT